MTPQIITLAEKIDAATKTLANQAELVKFVGRMGSPVDLAIAAAHKINSGEGCLSFIK